MPKKAGKALIVQNLSKERIHRSEEKILLEMVSTQKFSGELHEFQA